MQFTGSNGVAKQLCKVTLGKVKIEDAGFNFKILGIGFGSSELLRKKFDICIRVDNHYIAIRAFQSTQKHNILGKDVCDIDAVAWQCDQDAHASTGQKCSAQSIVVEGFCFDSEVRI